MGSDPSIWSAVHDLVHSWCRERLIAGAVLGIGDAQGPLVVRPFGDAGPYSSPEPMTRDAVFAIASITKTITSLQLMTLVEDGAVSLDVPVAEYLPEFGGNGKETVALWHLLTHTSGISQSANTMEGPASDRPPQTHLQAVLMAPLDRPPGTTVDYFSPGFWVVAEIITRLTGQPYWEHLQRRLLEPIGLRSTGYFAEQDPPKGFVPARMAPDGDAAPLVSDWGVVDPRTATMPELMDHARRSRYAAGGMLSTADDLLTYGRLYLRKGLSDDGVRVVTPRVIELMSRPWTVGLPAASPLRVEKGFRTERGLGWAIGGPGDLRSDRTLWHHGGFGTSIWIDPDRELVVVFLTASSYLRMRLLGQLINAVIGAYDRSMAPS